MPLSANRAKHSTTIAMPGANYPRPSQRIDVAIEQRRPGLPARESHGTNPATVAGATQKKMNEPASAVARFFMADPAGYYPTGELRPGRQPASGAAARLRRMTLEPTSLRGKIRPVLMERRPDEGHDA